MPGTTPPGERHSTDGLAAGYPHSFGCPVSLGLRPPSTRVEACFVTSGLMPSATQREQGLLP
jgi:hypothetical protein